MIKAFVILLRNTTWKCGVVERCVVNYLRRQKHSSVKDMLEHFEVKEAQHHRFFEAMERLEKRGIIRVMFKPFSSSQDRSSIPRQRGL